MSALFDRITGPILEAIRTPILPLLDMTTGGWCSVSTMCADPPNGIFRVERTTPHEGDDINQPGWTLTLSFWEVEIGLEVVPPVHMCAVALIWDKESLDNVVDQAATSRDFGYARFLTPGETIEWLAEEDL